MSNSINVLNWRNRTKLKLITYKGGKCERCGYCKLIPSAYDFHHTDPSKKDFGISGRCRKFELMKSEVDKCQLLCKNCHAETHWEIEQNKRLQRQTKQRHAAKIFLVTCLNCKLEFERNYNAKFCSINCRAKFRRKVERPNKELLAFELRNNSWVGVAKKYGVSDNCVRKWAKRYGLL